MTSVRHRRISSRASAVLAVCAVVWSPAPPLGAQAGSAPPKSAAPVTTTTPAKSTAAAAPETDGGWPRDYGTPSGGAVRVFQPQIASWDGQRKMVLYAAVSYSAKGAAKPVARDRRRSKPIRRVAVADRLVNFTQVKLTESNFPGLPNDQLREVVASHQRVGPEGP